jgi:hypothetical protein
MIPAVAWSRWIAFYPPSDVPIRANSPMLTGLFTTLRATRTFT